MCAQAALKGPEALPYFTVDWAVPAPWHKRVVHLNVAHLEKQAKHAAEPAPAPAGAPRMQHPQHTCIA